MHCANFSHASGLHDFPLPEMMLENDICLNNTEKNVNSTLLLPNLPPSYGLAYTALLMDGIHHYLNYSASYQRFYH